MFAALINLNFSMAHMYFLFHGGWAHHHELTTQFIVSKFHVFAQFFGNNIEHLQMYTCIYLSLCLNPAVFTLPLGQGPSSLTCIMEQFWPRSPCSGFQPCLAANSCLWASAGWVVSWLKQYSPFCLYLANCYLSFRVPFQDSFFLFLKKRPQFPRVVGYTCYM